MQNSIKRMTATLLLTLVACFFSTSALSNQYKELTLRDKVDNSNIVLIGQVTSVSKSDCLNLNSCASIKTLKLLKGSQLERISVLFDGPIAEDDPICCKVGSIYLFFLRRVKDDYYESANGPYGIYEAN
jgi:hypothetical protein